MGGRVGQAPQHFPIKLYFFLVVRIPKIDFLWFFQIFKIIFSASANHLKSRFKILKTLILSFFSYLLLHNSKYMWAMYMKLSETIEGVYVSAHFKFQTSTSFILSATQSLSWVLGTKARNAPQFRAISSFLLLHISKHMWAMSIKLLLTI